MSLRASSQVDAAQGLISLYYHGHVLQHPTISAGNQPASADPDLHAAADDAMVRIRQLQSDTSVVLHCAKQYLADGEDEPQAQLTGNDQPVATPLDVVPSVVKMGGANHNVQMSWNDHQVVPGNVQHASASLHEVTTSTSRDFQGEPIRAQSIGIVTPQATVVNALSMVETKRVASREPRRGKGDRSRKRLRTNLENLGILLQVADRTSHKVVEQAFHYLTTFQTKLQRM